MSLNGHGQPNTMFTANLYIEIVNLWIHLISRNKLFDTGHKNIY